MSVTKRQRFDVFKRDDFTCQYCGRTVPEVVLECDHIIPKKEGGTDQNENLVTSCFDCNRGKGKNPLSEKKQRIILEGKREIMEQAVAYEEFLLEARKVKGKWLRSVVRYFVEVSGYAPSRSQEKTLKMFFHKLMPSEIMDSIDITAAMQKNISSHDGFRYFCGVCWTKIKAKKGEQEDE